MEKKQKAFDFIGFRLDPVRDAQIIRWLENSRKRDLTISQAVRLALREMIERESKHERET